MTLAPPTASPTAGPSARLADLATYRPENRVPAEYFAQFAEDDALADNLMFRAPTFRHHAADGETSADMIVTAARTLRDRHGSDYLDDVDVILTHSQLPEVPVRGCVGDVAHRLGLRPTTVVDVHNGGCAAFVHLIDLARALLTANGGRKALIGLAQNSAGQIFTQPQVRGKAQAPIPGDGAAVATVTLDPDTGSEVLAVQSRTYGEYAPDMTAVSDPPRKYWAAGPGEIHVGFTEAKISKVLARGNRLVPEVALAVADRIGMRSADLDWFITNQPNRIFLRNWRDALQLPEERHPDTFDACGNLFAVGIPMTLDAIIDDGRLHTGEVVMMSAFAHAGDFAAAAAIRWAGRS